MTVNELIEALQQAARSGDGEKPVAVSVPTHGISRVVGYPNRVTGTYPGSERYVWLWGA